MDLLTILGTLFIGPLKLVFELIFQLANSYVGHAGISIIFLSLCMNVLVLPLYRRADAMQEQARDTELKLHRGVAHIKKSFSGDERMMILQAYYRQNNYKPTDALKGSLSLLLEIPFFMAAYQFLSSLQILQGVSLGPIKDLSAPDGLLVIGGFAINVLPILMTLINVISCIIYLKGFPLKSKIQLYGMALFFLVFLYTSPSGLVFYWTLNNLFSLIKTVFYKLKHPALILRILTSVLGAFLLVFGGFVYETDSVAKRIFLVALGAILLLPLLLPLLRSKRSARAETPTAAPNKTIFVLGTVFLTVLVGVLIPATFIAASPQEYVDVAYFHHPLWYLVSSACMAAGLFLIWLSVFYWLATPRGKVIFQHAVWILCGVMLVNYMFFGTGLGNMSPSLQYDDGMQFATAEILINLAVIAAVCALFYLLIVKWKKLVSMVLITALAAFTVMSVVNIVIIGVQVSSIATEKSEEAPHFNLSKNGKNVVVIMLDRAMGLYTPYIFNEKPELRDQFSGFTYYSNVISHGGYTNFGSPGLFGGYEYTPVEMNKRDGEKLVEKHNEAISMMPVLFSQHGYTTTVCDPVYANYQWKTDTSIFDGYENVRAFAVEGSFGDTKPIQLMIAANHRNFFCFGMMKSMPVLLQPILYSGGTYNQIDVSDYETPVYSVQTIKEGSASIAEGYSKNFMRPYETLQNLTTMTRITEEGNTFMYLSNNLTHEPMLLQEPDYVPAYKVDNTAFDEANGDRFTVNGRTLIMDTYNKLRHYQTNMAAMIQIGAWLDDLREMGVYDNTKIILVSDHGRQLWHTTDLRMGNTDAGFYYPLLMVKDFDAEGFTVSDEFMTNADVPTLATEGAIENPVNPFTGKAINMDEKTAHDQYIILSGVHQVNKNNGKTFLPSEWARVTDNIWDKSQWKFYREEVVLKEHAFPDESH